MAKPLIALLILGSIATSASAHGTCMHEMASEHAFQQSSTQSQQIGGALSHYGYFGRGAAGFGRW